MLRSVTAWTPKGWADAARQLGVLLGIDLIYELGRGLADSSRAVAIHHGSQVIFFERATHTFFEPALQRFFLSTHWTIDLADFLYLNSQSSVALGFLFWLYLFHNESYYFVRNMFVVAMCLALIGYVGYPTAPPRMFPGDGFVDTITKYSPVNHNSKIAKIFINPYAAVPSVHCAWGLMIGGTGIAVCRHWWSRAWWAFWPILVAWVVIVTANHYWLDWALGWLVPLAAFAVAKWMLARWKPEVWDWRTRPVESSRESGPAASP